MRSDVLVVGQVEGYIDVVKFIGTDPHVTHSVQIEEAGDINNMAFANKQGEFIMACQRGLLECCITEENIFAVIRSVQVYKKLYVANVCWSGGNNYVVVTTRSRYKSKKEIPPGENNFVIITYAVYSANEGGTAVRHVLLGHYRSSFKQVSFPVCRVQVIMQQNGGIHGFDESAFKGRFLLCMVDKHLKVIDTEKNQIFDLISEPDFDQEAICSVGLARSFSDRKSRLLLLCSGCFVKKIEFRGSLPENLNLQV